MAEPFDAIFGKPFPEQIAALRFRLEDLVPTERWDDLVRDAHDRSFVVAGAMKADLLADLAEAVQRSIEEDGTLEQFRSDFRKIVKRHGWHGWTGEGTKKGEAWRTKVIYKTNAATSYAAGRMAQLVEAGFKYWIYRHGGSAHPRLHHLDWDGLVLRADHEFWLTHGPPNGWGCSCYILGANSRKAAELLGGDLSKSLTENWKDIDPRTGEMTGIGKGWGYSPGHSVVRTVALAADKIKALPAEIGAGFASSIQYHIERAWAEWFARARTEAKIGPGFVGAFSKPHLDVLGSHGLKPVSAEITIRPGLIYGRKALRHIDKGDALPDELWIGFPHHVQRPVAILHDTVNEKIVYILKFEGSQFQVTIQPHYRLKGEAGHGHSGMVVSAYQARDHALAARLKAGQLKLLWGAVE